MNPSEWNELVERFLFAAERTAGTREQYGLSARSYVDWCFRQGVDPLTATTADILAHRQSLLDNGRKLSTVETRTYGIRAFYRYLLRQRLVDENPAADIANTSGRNVRDVLTVEELAALWDMSAGIDRAIVGLLSLCAVRRAELQAARVEHFVDRDGTMVMTLPTRTSKQDFGFVAVPPQLAVEVRAQIGHRRSGVLFPGFQGRDSISDSQVQTVIDRVAGRVGIPFRVTALTLNFTLRALAIENRFSYLSVVRTVSESEPRRLAQWANRLDLPFSEHASMRLARMVESVGTEDGAMFARAEFLLGDRSQHPAVSLLLAAATLEMVLRSLTQANGIEVRKKDPTLSTYATLLRGKGHVSLADLRTIDRVLEFRNRAAHGYFDLIHRDDAKWVVRESEAIAHRLSAPR